MSEPGWYPDPEDAERVRYWDGNAWAPSMVTADGANGRPGASRKWWVVGVAALVVLLAAVLMIPGLTGNDVAQPDADPTGPRPTESQWDELPATETPAPDDEPSQADEVECPVGDPGARTSTSDGQWIRGGGLAFSHPGDPWETSVSLSANIPWAHDADGLRSSGSGFYNVIIVAELHPQQGFNSPKSSAHMVFDCQASETYYTGVRDVEVTRDEPIEVDGLQGWYVQGLVHSTSGLVDRVDVIVLDDGELLPTFHGVVNSEVPEHVVGVDDAMASLQHEG